MNCMATAMLVLWVFVSFFEGNKELKDASQFLERGEYESALISYNAFLEEDPQDVDSLYGRAMCHYRLANNDASLKDIEVLLGIDKKHIESMTLKGNIFLRQGKNDDAVIVYREVLRREPRNFAAIMGCGSAYYNSKHYSAAGLMFSSILRQEKSHCEAYYRRGTTWLRLNQLPEAISDFEAMKACSPVNKHYRAHLCLATAYSRTGPEEKVYDELDKYCQNIFSHHTNDEDLMYQAATFQLMYYSAFKKDSREALASINTIIEQNSALGSLYYVRGSHLFCEEKYDLGIRDYEQALLLGVSKIIEMQINNQLAMVYARAFDDSSRNFDKAKEYALSNCILTNYQEWQPLAKYAEILSHEEDFVKAQEWQQKAIDLAPPATQGKLRVQLAKYHNRISAYADDVNKVGGLFKAKPNLIFGIPETFDAELR